ncbi:MAG: Pilus assembly protein TadC [Candidatus Methanohalarchaeum thermophilum]|uniref:Pilus assembly protein TadC n=1 Tax=Methanohalarchaeum thermophilum TaxID=1903181 RepID=A0A1Q6DUW1_METT1|nr:MAG: Pilus assembly protein TadC [Candidatus Methanohalarchaeum thermophilum]
MKNSFFQKIAFSIFGNHIEKNKKNYHNITKNLQKARMEVPAEIWLSKALFTSLIVFSLVFSFLIATVVYFGGLEKIIGIDLIDLVLNYRYYYIELTPKKVIETVLVGLFLLSPILSALIIYQIFKWIPKFRANQRGREITSMLPYAVNYISAMAGAGVTPPKIFKNLAEAETYGKVSDEARYIYRNTEVFGMDIITSLRHTARNTASDRFQEFLQGAITTLTSGGDLKNYFKRKTEQYMRESRQEQKEFLDTLSLIGESYVTTFVAGPLFIIVMVVVMSMLGGANVMILYLIVYIAIPFGTVLFVLLIDIITPEV